MTTPIGRWRKWFAWRPIWTETEGMRWMVLVERRRMLERTSDGEKPFWQYRPVGSTWDADWEGE